MPNFEPAQPLPGDDVPVTVPVSPNQFGAFIGTPSDVAAQQARDQAAAVAGQAAYQQRVAAAPVAANAPPSVVPQPLPAPAAVPAPVQVPPVTTPTPAVVPQAAVTPAATPTPASPSPPASAGGAAAPAKGPTPAAPNALDAANQNFDAKAKAEHDATVAAGDAEATGLQNVADANAINAQREVDRQRKDSEDRARFQKKIDQVQKSYADDKYQGFKLSPGREVLSALGLLLGGFSYDPHHVNQSVQIYEDAVKNDFSKWQANHDTLYKNLQTTIEEGKQLSTEQLTRASEARIADAAKLQAVIDQSKALASRSKNAAAVSAVDKANAQLGVAHAQALTEAFRLDQLANETGRHNRATEGIERAKVGVEAERNRIYGGNAQDLKVTNLVNGVVQKDKEAAKSLAEQDELRGALDNIDSGNSVAIGAALDRYVKAATGLGARPGNIKLITDRLGGSYQELLGTIGRLQNGEPLAPKQVARLRDAIQSQFDSNQTQITHHRARIENGLRKNPALAKYGDAITSALDTKFGPAAPAAASGPPKGSMSGKLPDGRAAFKYPDGTVHLADGSLVQ